MHSKQELKQDLLQLGVREGDCLLVHSSFKSLGGVEGGAEGFFDVLLSLLGQEGTLVMPTLSYETVFLEELPGLVYGHVMCPYFFYVL